NLNRFIKLRSSKWTLNIIITSPTLSLFPNYAIYNKHIWERYKISLQYKELLIPYNPIFFAPV
ncbi:MAG: hypothetical protein Q8P40_08390, partial [Nitrospirota bacterium]|nr:hypothetical protein [Nitrospirota bacterium]